MMISKWRWAFYLGSVFSLAAGGLWFLYQEEELPRHATLEGLSLSPVQPGKPMAEHASEDSGIEVAIRGSAPLVWPKGSVPGELVMHFGSRSELEDFLRDARRAGLTDLEAIPGLNLVRVRAGSDDEARLAWKLAGKSGVALNPLVAAHEVPPLDGMSGRYLAFGDQALAWMGVPEDNSSWGEGVRIAVVDTGVDAHPALLNTSITHMSVLEAEARLAGVGSHGTSVASLLSGQGEVRGVAPGAEILSIQVLGADGSGSGFDLAEGIVAAVDNGADFVNLSLGTTDSGILRQAVQYAQDRGVIIVASAGNDGAGRLLYPAAYQGVVAVGSVDANSQHVPFSNRGDNLSVAAPGYGLVAAGPEGSVVHLSGTSFSTPLVTGSLAYLSQSMSTAEAVQVLQSNTNDGGPPGADGYYGRGVIDMERVEWRDVAGIHDIAVADHYLDSTGEMLITVQNRGTERVGNISLEVSINGQLQRLPLDALAVGDTTAGTISLGEFLDSPDAVEIFSRVIVPGLPDVRPDNDIKGSNVRFDEPVH